MYLEISSRKCGKTKRLIEAALEELFDIEKGYTIHIVTPRDPIYIKDKFWKMFREKMDGACVSEKDFKHFRNRVYFETKHELKSIADRISFSWLHRAFFDDFDFMQIDAQLGSIQKILLKDAVYWSTVANGYHTHPDFLTRLIEANGGVYSTAPISKAHIEAEKRLYCGDEKLMDNELKNVFLT